MSLSDGPQTTSSDESLIVWPEPMTLVRNSSGMPIESLHPLLSCPFFHTLRRDPHCLSHIQLKSMPIDFVAAV
jgi:hypothetical protein